MIPRSCDIYIDGDTHGAPPSRYRRLLLGTADRLEYLHRVNHSEHVQGGAKDRLSSWCQRRGKEVQTGRRGGLSGGVQGGATTSVIERRFVVSRSQTNKIRSLFLFVWQNSREIE
jgi:hypothetical protein